MSTVFHSIRVDSYCRFYLCPVFHSIGVDSYCRFYLCPQCFTLYELTRTVDSPYVHSVSLYTS